MKELEPYQRELIAEYRQLDAHWYKLRDARYNAIGAEKQFKDGADMALLNSQQKAMDKYLRCLSDRMIDEGIENETVERFDYPGDMSDGYHTFNELYRYRMLYNAAFLNEYAAHQDVVTASDGYKSIIVRNVGKSRLHHDGTEPFGGGWFIVWFALPNGQIISNHYENQYWNLFHIPEEPTAPEWKGTTPREEADMMQQWLEQTAKSKRE